MQVSVLASGSSGNSVYVESDKSKILFDCGVSGKYIHNAMEKIGRDPSQINAIVVSHEHHDHIAGVGVLSRKYNIPVYINKPTYEESVPITKELDNTNKSSEMDIGDINIQSIKISHDAVKPRAFIISNKKTKLGIITDLGYVDSCIEKAVKSVNTVILESNHDSEMLRLGPYPKMLKRRVASDKGHISNFQAANLICEHATPKLKNVFLAHLSRTNNSQEIAYNTFTSTLWHRQDLNLDIEIAEPFSPSRLLQLN